MLQGFRGRLALERIIVTSGLFVISAYASMDGSTDTQKNESHDALTIIVCRCKGFTAELVHTLENLVHQKPVKVIVASNQLSVRTTNTE